MTEQEYQELQQMAARIATKAASHVELSPADICKGAGHDWSRSYEIREQPGMLWRKCQRCGAEETSQRPERKETVLVLADCGHRVLPSQMMGTSTGSSCPDCYDKMSV